ncbi:MAG: MFS transporter [Phycisphaerales bacterium]
MLLRFSLYGFLKNQRYFEPFLLLAFLDKGMSFFAIGALVAFREVCINLLGIPTGAIADTCGRRLAMILSFAAYIASFLIFGLSSSPLLLYPAMLLFAVGESFREGTHKAMIFTWLRINGRIDERTRVYGFTRSWSQLGSALSVILAAVFVVATDGYRYVFLFAIIPYALNIVNFLGYPRELDGDIDPRASLRAVGAHLRDAVVQAVRKPGLRRLMLESMGFEGVFKAVKDYLQPVLKVFAAGTLAHAGLSALPGFERWTDTQRGAVMIGAVYFVLYLLSAYGSRQAHRLTAALRGEERASRALWAAVAALYAGVLLAALLEGPARGAVLIPAFVLLHAAQSVWRPVIISRFDSHTREQQGATMLSIESQAQGLATLVLAPLLGLAIDALRARGLEGGAEFWPVGAVGLVAALAFIVTARAKRATPDGPAPGTA